MEGAESRDGEASHRRQVDKWPSEALNDGDQIIALSKIGGNAIRRSASAPRYGDSLGGAARHGKLIWRQFKRISIALAGSQLL